MSNLLYPIYKLPEEFMQDYEKRELPRYMKYWLYLKSKIKKSIIKEGSSFDLNGTVNKKFIKFEIEGNTEQAQYEGKNLFDKDAEITNTSNITSYSYNNGKYTIIPTGTGNPNFSIKIPNLPAGNYYFKSEVSLSNATALGNSGGVTFNFGSNYNRSFTTTEESTIIGFNWGNPENTEPFILDLSTLQIEAGTTPTTYEPYVRAGYLAQTQNTHNKLKM